jgi:RNA polymerase sigma factor (sigma-70 family)
MNAHSNVARQPAPELESRSREELTKLVESAQSGNIQAFEELIRHYEKPLVGYLYRLVQGDAEDLAQEVLIKAHSALKSLKNPETFWPWLVAIARNQAFSFLKRPHHSLSPAPIARSPETEVESREVVLRLEGALTALPTDVRDVLMLRYYCGFESSTISELLGTTPDKARSRLAYARKLLRDELIRRGGF